MHIIFLVVFLFSSTARSVATGKSENQCKSNPPTRKTSSNRAPGPIGALQQRAVETLSVEELIKVPLQGSITIVKEISTRTRGQSHLNMRILLLLICALLSCTVHSAPKSNNDLQCKLSASVRTSKPTSAGRHHRRMEPLDPMTLRDCNDRGWDYLSLFFMDPEMTGRMIRNWVHTGQEIRGPEGHTQRDYLHYDVQPAYWTFDLCEDDEENDLSSVQHALANILPDGQAAQEESERPDRPNVGKRAPDGPNRCFHWSQDQAFIPLGSDTLVRRTKAHFQAHYNVRDGIVIVQDVVTPESGRERHYDHGPQDRTVPDARQISHELPQLKDWEDLLFITWEKAKMMATHEGHQPRENAPRWLVLQDAWGGDQVLRIVRTCLRARSFRDDGIPPFPGQIFFAGGWCFNSLLQTEQSVRFVWLLALHKNTWGEKTLTSVRVFKSDRPETMLPSLIWELGEASDEAHREADQQHNKGLGGP
ncbi:hypothetical protein Q7P37_004853 [Cladosporium fusiforme]